jgi:hypothetical protein
MAKQLIVPLGSAGHSHATVPSVKPVIEGGIKTKLLRMIAVFSRYFHGQDQHQFGGSYIPRKSREEESHLELQRFLYW